MIVVLGFVLVATSGVISYLDSVTRRGYDFSGFREIVLPMLNPLTTIAALFAWWWLSRLDANDEVQRTLLRRAYVAFAAQLLFTSILILLIITPFPLLEGFWMESVLVLQLVGAFISALGLFVYSRALAPRVTHDDLVTESTAPL